MGKLLFFHRMKIFNLYRSFRAKEKEKKYRWTLCTAKRSDVWSSSPQTRKLYQSNQQVYVGHKVGEQILGKAPREATRARNNNLHSTLQVIWNIWMVWAHCNTVFSSYHSFCFFSQQGERCCDTRGDSVVILSVPPSSVGTKGIREWSTSVISGL